MSVSLRPNVVAVPNPRAIIANKCAACSSSSRRRTYTRTANAELLTVFHLISLECSLDHFYCNKCLVIAQRRVELQKLQQTNATTNSSATSMERSAANQAQHKTNSIASGSQPAAGGGDSQLQRPVLLLSPVQEQRALAAARRRSSEGLLHVEDSVLSASSASLNATSQTVRESECIYNQAGLNSQQFADFNQLNTIKQYVCVCQT